MSLTNTSHLPSSFTLDAPIPSQEERVLEKKAVINNYIFAFNVSAYKLEVSAHRSDFRLGTYEVRTMFRISLIINAIFAYHCHNTMLGDQIETQLSQPPTPLLVPFLPFKHTVLYAVTLCCNIQSSHF